MASDETGPPGARAAPRGAMASDETGPQRRGCDETGTKAIPAPYRARMAPCRARPARLARLRRRDETLLGAT